MKAIQEMRDAIAFYDERGWDWSDVVTFIGIRHAFRSWRELCDWLRPGGGGRPRKKRESSYAPKEAE